MTEIKGPGGVILLSVESNNLRRADLEGASLMGADLMGADLRGANLRGANLQGAELSGANLRRADLRRADLRRANLRGANLQEADLREADLREADLRGANLRGADLQGADLIGARLPDFQLPEGELVVWKRGQGALIKMIIPATARRTACLVSRKCRAEYARVIKIIADRPGVSAAQCASRHDSAFVYQVGSMVRPDSYDDNPAIECTHGIHFYATRVEAEAE